MLVDMSPTQRKRIEKIERLRRYFKSEDRPESYEWSAGKDENLDFSSMTDDEVTAYLNAAK
jgi:hypothetical protein